MSLHDDIVKSAVEYCKKEGFTNIKATLPDSGFDYPDEYSGKIPDIEADKDGVKHLIEIETCDNISNTETIDQLRKLHKACVDSGYRFIVEVPAHCPEEAKDILSKNGISCEFWRYGKV